MAGYQSCTIVGNVGRDPEFKYTQSGAAVCDFSVAVTERWGSGENRREKTTWFRVTCWQRLAEIANQYVRKGTQILVVGSVEASAYLDRSGQPASSLEMRANTFQLLGSRADSQGGDYGSGDYSGGDYGGQQSGNVDDIPF